MLDAEITASCFSFAALSESCLGDGEVQSFRQLIALLLAAFLGRGNAGVDGTAGGVLGNPGTRRNRGVDTVDLDLFRLLHGGGDLGSDRTGLPGGVYGMMLGLGVAALA